MPVYFGNLPPYCPISKDSPIGPESPWAPPIRTTIPRATDLISAIAAVNIARTIIQNIVTSKIINNVYTPPPWPPRPVPADRFRDKRKHARFVEQKEQRVKNRYKYYATKVKGGKEQKDEDNWVMTERIERMVWYDKGFKATMVWEYGNKGEGEFVPKTG